MSRKPQLVKEYVKLAEVAKEMLKARCGPDLYLFNKYVLGVETGSEKVPLGQFHKEICYFVQNRRDRKKLLLVPRGHLKSTLITIGYPIFRLVENINTRVLILNATWQMAVDFLTEIKNHLQKNETLINTFGSMADNPIEWSQDRITLQRSDHGVKGPTVWATGVESNLVGSHPDLIIMDDVVNRDIADSEDLASKVILRYKDALDLLEPGGQLIVIGTCWTDKDLYEWLRNPDNKVIQGYDLLIRPAFEFEGTLEQVFSEGGEALMQNRLWPEKFSYKELKSRYTGKGPYEFSAQYLLNPVPEDSAIFRKEWFKYIELEDWKGRMVNRYMTVDPAISLAKEADYTGIIITDVDQYGNILVRHIDRARVSPYDLINRIFFLADQYHPNSIGVETVAFQKTLQYFLNEEMKRRGKFLPIREITPGDRTKAERIKSLQPLYAGGKILHSKAVQNLQLLEDELLRFPRGKHDDMIDAFSYMTDMIVSPRPRREHYHQHYLYGQER